MSSTDDTATFERLTTFEETGTTLIEGLPGHGLVAAIAVDQITRQLDLDHHGTIYADTFPPVTSFKDGRVQDLVRVNAGADPPVMTLQSDIALPFPAFEALTDCVLTEISTEFERAIFLAGAPVTQEEQIGTIVGVATTDELQSQLEAAGVELADGVGLIGDVTGALVEGCYRADVPAAVLIVGAHPFVPDPGAARTVIEEALEPLVAFDIDTTELQEQSEEIQQRMRQIAEQYQQVAGGSEGDQLPHQATPSMYQ